MRQPVKKQKIRRVYNRHKTAEEHNKMPPRYGTSKLEKNFAKEYLDTLGLSYVYQYYVKDIGRYFDFAIVYDGGKLVMEEKEGLSCVKQTEKSKPMFLVEVDGDYFHGNPQFYMKLTATQRHNKIVDAVKTEWAKKEGMPLLRLWENDVRWNTKDVMNKIINYLLVAYKKKGDMTEYSYFMGILDKWAEEDNILDVKDNLVSV